MPDWNQLAPIAFGAFGLAVIAGIGRGLHWIVSIPQRRSLSTVEALKTLMAGMESLHSQELKFRDRVIAERDREIASLKETKVLGSSETQNQD